jgi:hypothetical protein
MAKSKKTNRRNTPRAGNAIIKVGQNFRGFDGKEYIYKPTKEALLAALKQRGVKSTTPRPGAGKLPVGSSKSSGKSALKNKAPTRVVKGKDLGKLLGKGKPKVLPDLTAGKTPKGVIKPADLSAALSMGKGSGKGRRKSGSGGGPGGNPPKGPKGTLKGRALTEALRAKKDKSAVTRQAKANRLKARRRAGALDRGAEAKRANSFKNKFLSGFNSTRNIVGKGRELLSKATGEAKSLFRPFLQGGGNSGGNKFRKIGKNNARYARAGKVGGHYKHTNKGGGYSHKPIKNYNYEQRVKVAKKTGNRPT